MKALLVATLAALALSVTATAGNPSLCARDGWQTAQASNGAAFASHKECTKAKDVYQPTLTLSPEAVQAEQFFDLTATGFHSDAGVTLTFSVTGQAPYFSYPGATNGAGVFVLYTFFQSCGTASPYSLTLTVTDSFGVHASAPMTLC